MELWLGTIFCHKDVSPPGLKSSVLPLIQRAPAVGALLHPMEVNTAPICLILKANWNQHAARRRLATVSAPRRS